MLRSEDGLAIMKTYVMREPDDVPARLFWPANSLKWAAGTRHTPFGGNCGSGASWAAKFGIA